MLKTGGIKGIISYWNISFFRNVCYDNSLVLGMTIIIVVGEFYVVDMLVEQDQG